MAENECDDQAGSAPSRRKFLGGLAVSAVVAGVPGVALAQQGRGGGRGRGVSPKPGSAANAVRQTSSVAQTSTAATDTEVRRAAALKRRQQAAQLAADMPVVQHIANGDEQVDPRYGLSFTKGLPHDYDTGLVTRPGDYEHFVRATGTGLAADFAATPLGPDDGFRTAPDDRPLRAWESQSIGLTYDLIGPDMQAVTMPPAPRVESVEQIGEMAEVYAQATLRDTPLASLRNGTDRTGQQEEVIQALRELPWFDGATRISDLTAEAEIRRRTDLTAQTAFRGIAPGDTDGPYVSQLLLTGTPGPGGRVAADGLVSFGGQTINQRVRRAVEQDFMTSWDEWFDVQNAMVPAVRERFEGADRFITTGRDLATYVHSDALYQPYLTASLVLFGHRTPLDPGMPFQAPDRDDHQQGFVLFGGPHVLALLAEVCMRALKTVKYQKFNVHRRLRPEELAARIEKADELAIAEVDALAEGLARGRIASDIRAMNAQTSGVESMLLPMAFAEGSPMHPSYGAGHGVVAGACATVMKALFDHNHRVGVAGSPSQAFVANNDGSALDVVDVFDADGNPTELTVEGEINKLAANISIGRDWAGVHYFSDYWESVLMGEAIAIQILREHMLTTSTPYSLTVPTFAGETIIVS